MKRSVGIMMSALLLLPCFALGDEQLHQRPIYKLHIGDVIVLNYRYTQSSTKRSRYNPMEVSTSTLLEV